MKLLTLFLLMFCCTCFAQNADIYVLKEIHLGRNKQLDKAITFISNSEYVVGASMPFIMYAAAWYKNDSTLRKGALLMGGTILMNTAITLATKRLVNRSRPGVTYPYLEPFERDRYFSFPSGHTSNAFCIATSLSLQFKKWYVVFPSYLWAGTVGYSRLHMGMHYPSDVLVGAAVGIGSAILCRKLNKWLF